MGKRKGKHLELFVEPLNYFPVPKGFETFSGLSIITDYLLFLQILPRDDSYVKKLIKYFHEEIADPIIFEIYFWNEISKDEESPFELKEYILQKLVSIDYEQVLTDLDRFRLLKEEYLEIIKRCYISLNDDDILKQKLYQIRSNPIFKLIFDFYHSSTYII